VQRAIIYCDWCIHEDRAPTFGGYDGLRRMWFRNLMNCVRFAIDHDVTWDWPKKVKES
jgi:hypothetical protein